MLCREMSNEHEEALLWRHCNDPLSLATMLYEFCSISCQLILDELWPHLLYLLTIKVMLCLNLICWQMFLNIAMKRKQCVSNQTYFCKNSKYCNFYISKHNGQLNYCFIHNIYNEWLFMHDVILLTSPHWNMSRALDTWWPWPLIMLQCWRSSWLMSVSWQETPAPPSRSSSVIHTVHVQWHEHQAADPLTITHGQPLWMSWTSLSIMNTSATYRLLMDKLQDT